MAEVLKIFKERGDINGAEAHGYGFRTEASCGSSSRITSGLALMPFRAFANAGCPEFHHLQGHWTCFKCPQGLKTVYGD